MLINYLYITLIFSTFTFIISGVGTRNYYRKLGYELEGPYMTKTIS